ncbi:MAG: sigma-70 family RNA polymerase sigma factor [Planctomycetota bacterium]
MSDADAALIARMSEGDEAALAELVERHEGALVRLAEQVLRERAAAEDVVQEVFVRLWDDPARYEPGRGTVAGMLRNWVRARALDASRRRGARERATERASDRMPRALDPVSRADKTGLENALALLPPEQRELVERMYYEGKTQAELAGETGLALGTVKSRLRLGMERLRERFRHATQRELPRVRGVGREPDEEEGAGP